MPAISGSRARSARRRSTRRRPACSTSSLRPPRGGRAAVRACPSSRAGSFRLLWDDLIEPGLGTTLVAYAGSRPRSRPRCSCAGTGRRSTVRRLPTPAHWALRPNTCSSGRRSALRCERGDHTFDFRPHRASRTAGLREFKAGLGRRRGAARLPDDAAGGDGRVARALGARDPPRARLVLPRGSARRRTAFASLTDGHLAPACKGRVLRLCDRSVSAQGALRAVTDLAQSGSQSKVTCPPKTCRVGPERWRPAA